MFGKRYAISDNTGSGLRSVNSERIDDDWTITVSSDSE